MEKPELFFFNVRQMQLDKMVSLHARSAKFPALSDVSFFVRGLMHLYDDYREAQRSAPKQVLYSECGCFLTPKLSIKY